jgi:hypothetical protein
VEPGWNRSRSASRRLRALALVGVAIVVATVVPPGSVGARDAEAARKRRAPKCATPVTISVTARRHPKRRPVCPGVFQKHRRLKIHKRTGGFPLVTVEETRGEKGERPPLPTGPFRAPPPARPEIPQTLAGGGISIPGLTIHANRLLPASVFPGGIYQPTGILTTQEPSVAHSGRVVLYAFNWDAGYSVDGGQTFTELDPHTTFPTNVAPFFSHFGADQVVTYDPLTDTFIWILQEFTSGSETVIRIAWTKPATLVQKGAGAWRYFDLPSDACCGFGSGHFLDQPRVGFTPKYLYMNVNEGTGNRIEHTIVIRIPRAQFGTAQGPSGYGFAILEPASLRVAQNVIGSRTYFVGHKNTSTLTVASIDDNSNVFSVQDIDEPTIANRNWTMTTPGGQDLLGRQVRSQNTAVTGVTQDGAGNLWVAWSEGRAIVNSSGTEVIPAGAPTQPHIAVATLSVTPSNPASISGGTLSYLWNANHAFFLPDLTTGESGEVALTYYWGGGTHYLNHAVAFLSGGFVSQTVASSNTDQSTTGNPGDNNFGNPAGDYKTVRRLPPPYGDCFVAAGVANRDENELVATSGTQAVVPPIGLARHVGLPVLTLFSRPGASCPHRFFPPPRPVIDPMVAPPSDQTITLTCPSSARAGESYQISGALSPVVSGAPISITYSSSDAGVAPVTHNVSTNSDGTFTDTAPGAPAGTETITARYEGDSTHGAAEQSCTVQVEPVFL